MTLLPRPLHSSILRLVAAALLVMTLVFVAWGTGEASERPTWELVICADPMSLPFTSADETGFENRIAEILADELGATLRYDWHFFNPDMIRYRLREGHCDVLLGVQDGFSDLLTTITYYRSPYVFVYRADAGFDIESLDDPLLRTLRIGVHSPGIPPHEALLNRGIVENVSMAYGSRTGTPDRLADLVEAVARGEVDVGIVFGPVAGYFAKFAEAELKIVPITPEFEPPTTFMSVPITMAVRPGDEALRDRLNVAIANRWDEIQAVLQEYGVPLSFTPRPTVRLASAPETEEPLRIGVVIPTRTGRSTNAASLFDIVGEAARVGALMAADLRFGAGATGGPEIKILLASSPSPEAARRAAERLVLLEKVHAIVGGIGYGQAEVLAEVAEKYHIPFLNIGSPDLLLRERAGRYTFHVEASGGMYLDALVDWHNSLGHRRWFIVYEDTGEGRALLERALRAIASRAPEATVVGTAAVAVEQPVYVNELNAAEKSGADVILVLLRAVDQMAFLAQMGGLGLSIDVAPYPDPVTQTRDYLAAALLRYDAMGMAARVALWDTTLAEDGADQLNLRFIGRSANPMDPSGWAAYQAVRILHQAAAATGAKDAETLIAYLEDPTTAFELNKGQRLFFGRDDHQLYQPLYVVQARPDAQWDVLNVFSRVEFARVLTQLPLDGGVYGQEAAATEAAEAAR